MTITDFLLMNNNADEIVKAIKSLQTAPNYLKDYMLPIATSFCSALFGGLTAIYINGRQALKTITRDNFIAANQIYLLAHECLTNLLAIKSNYNNIDSDEPLIRAGAFPTIINKLDDIKFNRHSLYFIRSIPTANKGLFERLSWVLKHRILRIKIREPTIDEVRNSWRNMARVSAMFDNYNQVMAILQFRNTINEEVKQALSKSDIMNFLPINQVKVILGSKLCAGYVDITEAAISTTDYVMSELHGFLLAFPVIAESNIELSRIREWGRFPTYHNDQKAFLSCMKPIALPDFKKVAEYTGMTEEAAKFKYILKSLI